MKLIQKQFFKGSREFEIVDDTVYVRIKSFLKEEKLTVGLAMINPDPVINGQFLEFYGRVKPEPMLSLMLNKPDTEEFNEFVDTLVRRALEESHDFVGINAAPYSHSQASALDRNIYEEPPEFEESQPSRPSYKEVSINVTEVDNMIQMLECYVAADEIKPMINALHALKAEPENEVRMQQVVNVFNGLGITQGAVLTYAPYISVLLSDDPFGNY